MGLAPKHFADCARKGALIMITADDFTYMLLALGAQGEKDVVWAEALCEPEDAEAFAAEVIFVVCNSGMKNTVARGIFDRCVLALEEGRGVFEVFKHPAKAAAIEKIWRDREALLAGYLAAADKLAFARRLPWIGPITSYHVVKNFGADVAKPDVHLQRLADRESCTAQALCERLARETGMRVATVDTILWRACATGILNSRTGELAPAVAESLL